MDIIIGKRGSGKTTKLIKRSADENMYIITTTKQRALYIMDMAIRMGVLIPFPVTLDEYLKFKLMGHPFKDKGLLIDDADDLLKQLFIGFQIKEITITDHDEVGNCIRYLQNYQMPMPGTVARLQNILGVKEGESND